MNKKHISSAALAVVAVLSGCTGNLIETTFASKGLADLELSYVGSAKIKAAIDGTTFPKDGEIGLFLFEDEQAAKTYGTGYENIRYSYDSTKSKWTSSPSIKVGSTPGYLFGYYPYCSTASDVKEIPVASSLDGDDVMYAASQTVTDATASQTSITMNHALARVSITVRNNGYIGEAKLSKIKLSGAEIAPTGTLNALDGSLTAVKSDVSLDVTGDAKTVVDAGTTYECLLVPSKVETGKQTIDLTLTIDGDDKTVTLSGDNGVIFAQGTKSNINVTLSNSGISVQAVSVEEWNVVEIGGHKVTIQTVDEDILTTAYVDGNNVVIRASSYSSKRLKCTMSGGECCTSQSKTGYLSPENLKVLSKFDYTFTISDIDSDAVATIGYANALSISSSSDPTEGGTVKVEGELYEGETVKLTASAATGYGFVNWQDKNGKILCESEEYVFRSSSKDIYVTAVFQKLLSLKVFVSPTCAGSISAFDSWNAKGKEISLTTTPGGNSVFKGWKDKDGNSLTDQSTYTFTMESDTVIIAEYSVDCVTGALSGVFTVAADNGYGKPKKVRFSKGNLWYGRNTDEWSDAFYFEENQWGFESTWKEVHVSSFFWSKDASISCKSTYSDPQASVDDIFFTNSASFAVNGVSAWYTLSSAEWDYLMGLSEERKGKYKIAVTVNEIEGLVIAPDEFDGEISYTYTAEEWIAAEKNSGLVFLPAAGRRIGEDFIDEDELSPGKTGFYWSASPSGNYEKAYSLYFAALGMHTSKEDWRIRGYSVRLVTDCQSEDSAE